MQSQAIQLMGKNYGCQRVGEVFAPTDWPKNLSITVTKEEVTAGCSTVQLLCGVCISLWCSADVTPPAATVFWLSGIIFLSKTHTHGRSFQKSSHQVWLCVRQCALLLNRPTNRKSRKLWPHQQLSGCANWRSKKAVRDEQIDMELFPLRNTLIKK